MAKKNANKARSRVETQVTMTAHDAADYLEGLARGLRAGSILIGETSRPIHATVAGDVDVEMAARRGKRRTRIELTLAFRADGDEPRKKEETTDYRTAEDKPATLPDEMRF